MRVPGLLLSRKCVLLFDLGRLGLALLVLLMLPRTESTSQMNGRPPPTPGSWSPSGEPTAHPPPEDAANPGRRWPVCSSPPPTKRTGPLLLLDRAHDTCPGRCSSGGGPRVLQRSVGGKELCPHWAPSPPPPPPPCFHRAFSQPLLLGGALPSS